MNSDGKFKAVCPDGRSGCSLKLISNFYFKFGGSIANEARLGSHLNRTGQPDAHRCVEQLSASSPCDMSLKFEFTADEVIREGRVTREDIEEIQKWLHLEMLPKLVDEQVAIFLLSCQNDLEKTKHTIHVYFKCKYMAPNMSKSRNMFSKELIQQTAIVESCVIPKRTKDNYMIIFQRFKNFSYWNFQLETSMKYLFMTFDLGLMKNPPDGVIALFDMKGMGIMHLTKLRVGALRIFFQFLQEGLPCQIRDIHIFNAAYFVDKLIAIVKPFMKKELYDMLHFHPCDMDMEDFFENCVEAECIPSDYGGKLPSVKTMDEISKEDLRQMSEWFSIEEETWQNYKPPK